MRGVVAVIVVVLLLALAGWVTFGSDSGSASINLETETIKEDTATAVEKGKQLLSDANAELDSSDDTAAEPSDLPSEP